MIISYLDPWGYKKPEHVLCYRQIVGDLFTQNPKHQFLNRKPLSSSLGPWLSNNQSQFEEQRLRALYYQCLRHKDLRMRVRKPRTKDLRNTGSGRGFRVANGVFGDLV